MMYTVKPMKHDLVAFQAWVMDSKVVGFYISGWQVDTYCLDLSYDVAMTLPLKFSLEKLVAGVPDDYKHLGFW